MNRENESAWGEENFNDHLRRHNEEDITAVNYITRYNSIEEDGQRMEEPESKIYFITEIYENDANLQSYWASNNEHEMATLKEEICTFLNPDDGLVDNRQIIDDLASFFKSDYFLTDVDEFVTVRRRMVENQIKTIFVKSTSAERMMACLSGCLVHVFWQLAGQQSPVAPEELKSKLTTCLDAVGRIVKDFDPQAWETWFSSDGKFADWVFFTASVFMPQGNDYVSMDETSRIENAVEFFEKFQQNQHVNRGDKSIKSPPPVMPETMYAGSSTSERKQEERKFEENGRGVSEVEMNEQQQRMKLMKTCNEKYRVDYLRKC